MKAIHLLERCRSADDEIERLRISVRQKRALATSISAPPGDPNGGGRGSGGDHDKIGRLAADIADLEERIAQREQEKSVEIAAASVLMDHLPGLESKILYGYYLRGESTGAVARRLKYQPNYVRRKKREAERILEELAPAQVAETLPRWYLQQNEKEVNEREEEREGGA